MRVNNKDFLPASECSVRPLKQW